MAASRSNSPKTVQSLMSIRDGTLSRLCAQAGELSRVNRLLTTLLPGPLARHVSACAVHDDTLVLQTDSPVWATRLRLEQQRLLAGIRTLDGLTCINRMRVTVAVPATSREQQKQTPRLSAIAAATLAQCAESQTDPALRASLIRLSRRV